MAIYKCRMCGGDLEIMSGTTVCECEYCGTKQTVPKVDDEQILKMLNRASYFRQQCDFDKAMEIYENALKTEDSDPEIYWAITLCRYGINYVDDPLTKKKIPTCHRMQYKSILEDADYLSALSYADSQQKEVYQQEAEYIAGVQKGILEISNKEKPFDVFICYKENDEDGTRTKDSVDAQELYYQLKEEGFKVFFARITLEEKLGTAYEPYIFAALNSAKVMVVLGSKPEYFNAVWVKNEWSRFLLLMQEDKSKTIIPAYKNMDPYDLPDALSMFQAQDMSKLGFMQDLIRGISKLVRRDSKKTSAPESAGSTAAPAASIAPLLKRVFMFLEDKEWQSADEYCEKVLDIDPECGKAYLGKLLVKLKVARKEELPGYHHDFSNSPYFQKALRFGEADLEELNRQSIYNGAVVEMEQAKDGQAYYEVEKHFRKLGDYADAPARADECIERANAYQYQQAEKLLEKAVDEQDFRAAGRRFAELKGYRDSAKQAKNCEERALSYQYDKANGIFSHAMDDKGYRRAAKAFEAISDYRDSRQRAAESEEKALVYLYKQATNMLQTAKTEGDFQKAAQAFARLKPYRDSGEKEKECGEKVKALYYDKAVSLFEEIKGRYPLTSQSFTQVANQFKQLGDFRDSQEKCKECEQAAKQVIYDEAAKMIDKNNPDSMRAAIRKFQEIQGFADVDQRIAELEHRIKALPKKKKMKGCLIWLVILGVITFFVVKKLVWVPYQEEQARIAQEAAEAARLEEENARKDAAYTKAVELMNANREMEGIAALSKLNGHKNADFLIMNCVSGYRDRLPDHKGMIACNTHYVMAVSPSGKFQDRYADWVGTDENWTDIIAVTMAATKDYVAGLRADGTVISTGWSFGADGSAEWTQIKQIEIGEDHMIGLRADGSVVGAGSDRRGSRTDVSEWRDIVDIAAGSGFSLGLKRDGTVVTAGILGDLDWQGIIAVAAADKFAFGITIEGKLVMETYDTGVTFLSEIENEYKSWNDIVACSIGLNHIVALKSDGTVVAAGNNESGQCNVSEWTDIVSIAAGGDATFGVKSDGTVLEAGDCGYGETRPKKLVNVQRMEK